MRRRRRRRMGRPQLVERLAHAVPRLFERRSRLGAEDICQACVDQFFHERVEPLAGILGPGSPRPGRGGCAVRRRRRRPPCATGTGARPRRALSCRRARGGWHRHLKFGARPTTRRYSYLHLLAVRPLDEQILTRRVAWRDGDHEALLSHLDTTHGHCVRGGVIDRG